MFCINWHSWIFLKNKKVSAIFLILSNRYLALPNTADNIQIQVNNAIFHSAHF